MFALSPRSAPTLRPLLAACLTAVLIPSCASVLTTADAASNTTATAVYALPKSLVHLEIKREGGELSLDVLDTMVVADPSARYSLQHLTSTFASDQLTIEMTPDGLLKKVSATTTDNTKDVLVAIVNTIGEAYKAGGGTPGSRVDSSKADTGAAFAVKAWLDPTSEHERCELNERLNTHDVSIGCSPLTTVATSKPSSDFAGVHHRAMIGFLLTLADKADKADKTGKAGKADNVVASLALSLVDSNTTYSTPVTRGAFIEKKTELTFSDGLLTKVTIDKPSEALGLVTIPLDVAKALVAVPAGFFSEIGDDVTQTTTTVPPASDNPLQ